MPEGEKHLPVEELCSETVLLQPDPRVCNLVVCGCSSEVLSWENCKQLHMTRC